MFIVISMTLFFQQTLEQWRKVFLITASMLISTGLLYLLFGNSELQEWNSGYTSSKDLETLRPINNKANNIKMNDIKIVQKGDKKSDLRRK